MISKLICAESFTRNSSGIACVARLMARVLCEHFHGTGQIRLLTLNDRFDNPGLTYPTNSANGSRIRFVIQNQLLSLSSSHSFYDSLGMARAHCFIPFLRIPFLSYIHGIEVWNGSQTNRIFAAKRATALVANSKFTVTRASEWNSVFEQAQVCPLATETDDKPVLLCPSQRRPDVLILGRIDKNSYKGHRELIDAWPNVVSSVPKSRLLIAGRGPGFDEVRNYARASSANANIELLGFLDDDEISSLWASCSVFAMPSRGEGFGLVYIEAMRQGVPVIASVHDAGQEVNVHGFSGLNVSLDTRGELAAALIELLRNPDYAATLGRNAQLRWEQMYSFSQFKLRFLTHALEFMESQV